MAGRYPKLGLDYHPKTINLHREESVLLLRAAVGWKGYLVMLSLFDYIFGNRGYYVEWTEQNQERYRAWSELCPFVSPQLITETVTACLKYGIFNKSAFEACNILTSYDIQHTWLIATRKRIKRYIVRDYWIYTAPQAEEMQFTAEEIRQTKGKEIFFINKDDTSLIDEIMKASTVQERVGKALSANGMAESGEENFGESPSDYKISHAQHLQNQRYKINDYCNQIRGMSVKYHTATNKQIEEMLSIFVKQQEILKKDLVTEDEITIHFINWLERKPKPTNKNVKENSRPTGGGDKHTESDPDSQYGESDI